VNGTRKNDINVSILYLPSLMVEIEAIALTSELSRIFHHMPICQRDGVPYMKCPLLGSMVLI
jgi:hypothetical protein